MEGIYAVLKKKIVGLFFYKCVGNWATSTQLVRG